MSFPSPVLLDANIPMYAAGASHPYQIPCQTVLAWVAGGQLSAVTNTEVHQEILHRYLSLGRPEQARQVSADFETLVPHVIPITLVEIRTARTLVQSYPQLAARDLLHVAVMLAHGITEIVSADRHFDQVAQITRLDPVQMVASTT